MILSDRDRLYEEFKDEPGLKILVKKCKYGFVHSAKRKVPITK